MMRVVTPASAAALRMRRTVSGGALGRATRTCSIVAVSHDLGQVARRADHLHAADRATLEPRVVVEEADGGQSEVGSVPDLAQEQRAGAARADDEHAPSLLAR